MDMPGHVRRILRRVESGDFLDGGAAVAYIRPEFAFIHPAVADDADSCDCYFVHLNLMFVSSLKCQVSNHTNSFSIPHTDRPISIYRNNDLTSFYKRQQTIFDTPKRLIIFII